jgi:hypothetical protein
VLDRHGEIAQLLGWLGHDGDGSDWERSWDPVEAATVAGRFTDGAGLALTLELAVDPTTDGPRRELLLADLERFFAEGWSAGKATVRPSSQGVTLDLLVDELPRHLEHRQDTAAAVAARP